MVNARELFRSLVMDEAQAVPVLAAALRREHDAALDDAAKICDEEQAEYWTASRAFDATGNHFSGAAEAHGACASKRIGERIRALIPPAAAPAAETVRCMCPSGAVAGSCPLRNDVQSICECRCHGAPPSEPAAPAPPQMDEDGCCVVCGRGLEPCYACGPVPAQVADARCPFEEQDCLDARHRIAELEAALRELTRAATEHANAHGCSGDLGARLSDAKALLAARTSPGGAGEGT